MSIGGYRFRRSFGNVDGRRFRGARPSLGGILDLYPGAAAAYSLRSLSSSATNVVRVRRSSDNAEQDFTATQITDGTLLTFTGAGDGFVATWYDQSGNTNDAAQVTATSQPKIVSSGVLVSGGLDFDGVADFLTSSGLDSTFRNMGNAFIFSAYQHDLATSGTECLFYAQAGALSGVARVFMGAVASNVSAAGRRLDADSFVQSTTAKTSGLKLRTGNYDWNGGDVQLFENGAGLTPTAFSSGAGLTSNTLNVPVTIGRLGGSASYLNGAVNEVIVYPSDQSANRVAIETNINDYYGIY